MRQKNLTAKRRKENDECKIRLQQARERIIRSQELAKEHREQEEGKRVAVDNAVTYLLNRDT